MKKEELAMQEAANAAERSGDYTFALDAWQRLASMTNRPDYLCKVGRIAQKLGMWTYAENAFLDALEVDKSLSLPMVLLGSLFLRRTDRDSLANAQTAKAWLEKALATAPSPNALSFLAAAHDRLGETSAAKEMFRRVIALDDSYAEAYLNLGILLAKDGENEEAERLLRMAMRLDPSSHKAHGSLGMLLQERGKYSEAEDEFRRAIEIDPTDAIASFRLNRSAGGAGTNKP